MDNSKRYNRSSIHHAGSVAKKLLDSYLGSGGDNKARLYKGWADIVGIDLAAHCKPIDIADGKLFIDADHPAWIAELHLQKKKIIAKMRNKFPMFDICAVVIRLL